MKKRILLLFIFCAGLFSSCSMDGEASVSSSLAVFSEITTTEVSGKVEGAMVIKIKESNFIVFMDHKETGLSDIAYVYFDPDDAKITEQVDRLEVGDIINFQYDDPSSPLREVYPSCYSTLTKFEVVGKANDALVEEYSHTDF